MKIAVEGCCHGELDAIYARVAELEQRNNYKVDLLLICGDFEAIRNHQDLQCMAVPPKYRHLGGFYKYYTGEKKAPILTVVIGGNHEASNYLWELYHGGWLAPDIYYLGFAGCIQVNGIRIAGASGIYKSHDYKQGHFERLPYDGSQMRSIYHIREFDVLRLSHLSKPDIFLSHDWPQGIEQYGDVNGLLRYKPFFRNEIAAGTLGSPPLTSLLQQLKPNWWFAAHMHCRFEATVTHEGTQADPKVDNPDEIKVDDFDEDEHLSASAPVPTAGPASVSEANPDEIVLDDEIETVIASPPKAQVTRFLALDKCLPKRQFLEVVDVPASQPSTDELRVTFDPEWLAITRAFHPFFSSGRSQKAYPKPHQSQQSVEKELKWVRNNVGDNEGMKSISDCQVFWPTAPGPGSEGSAKHQQPPWYTNPQTVAFCNLLGIENKINPAPAGVSLPSGSVPGGLPPR
ncbi:DBR1-domain-containing protein [Schizopora paradoxa]|uniref:DBR1-domain-containing protein n=1 Tax=Schizopora paradoxa TaxID=27342 RepID=A0A0H2SR98_9AGAM|nr:DBR1-domain-containing protein [Schizopora paradoxa]